jgi:4-hydroxyphenylpyruvate dioxygenase
MRTEDIITTVKRCMDRGVEFLTIPDTYYENLKKGLENAGIKVVEDIDEL